MKLTQEQATAIRCAYADLEGWLQHLTDGYDSDDSEPVELTLQQLREQFPELNLGDTI